VSHVCSNVCFNRCHVAVVMQLTYLTIIKIIGKGKAWRMSHGQFWLWLKQTATYWIHQFMLREFEMTWYAGDNVLVIEVTLIHSFIIIPKRKCIFNTSRHISPLFAFQLFILLYRCPTNIMLSEFEMTWYAEDDVFVIELTLIYSFSQPQNNP